MSKKHLRNRPIRPIPANPMVSDARVYDEENGLSVYVRLDQKKMNTNELLFIIPARSVRAYIKRLDRR